MGGFLPTSLQQRTASAAVMIPLTLAIVFYGGLPFLIFICLLLAVSAHEWTQMALKTKRRTLYMFFGIIYLPLSFWSCYLLRTDFPLEWAVMFVCLVWASDIGAYLFGKTIKGPKMASVISPNKTWAGYAGALIMPGLTAVILVNIYNLSQKAGFLDIQYVSCLFFAGLVIGVVCQSGDLFVSFVKRQANVKDTGHIIPGHGGVLDRIDSLLLAAPVFLYIVSELSHVLIP